MKIDIWIQTRDSIPHIAEKTGIRVETLVDRFVEAKVHDKMCFFQVDITPEQYEKITRKRKKIRR